MSDGRRKNTSWTVTIVAGGKEVSWEGAQLAVLMDIRDELQTLNRVLGCVRFTTIPDTLKTIAANTKRRPRTRKATQNGAAR